MLEKTEKHGIDHQTEFKTPKDNIEFDYTDIVAFTIAVFQVLLPYVIFIFGGLALVMIMYQLIFS